MKKENLLKKIEKNNLTFEAHKYVDKIIVNENTFVKIHYTDPQKTSARCFELNNDNIYFRTFGNILRFLEDANYIPA